MNLQGLFVLLAYAQYPMISVRVLLVADLAAGQSRAKKHKIYVTAFGAIFFMTNFYRAGGGGMTPLAPILDPLLLTSVSQQLVLNTFEVFIAKTM